MKQFLSTALIILSVGSLIPYSSLNAEIICNGRICNNFPALIGDLNSVMGKIESDYLQEILKNNTEASFLTNVMSSYVGKGHVSKFQVGLGISLSGGRRDSVDIVSKNLSWENLPNGGFDFSPSINLNFNLGWILQRPVDSYWNRFSIFLHGMNVRLTNSDLNSVEALDERLNLKSEISNVGGMIRWQVAQGRYFARNIFSWNGFNLGIGLHNGTMESQVFVKNRNPQKLKWNSMDARWGGDSEFLYNTSTRTYNTDIRTGLGILNILHLTVGIGMSWNSGETEMSLKREGPFVLKTGSIASWEVPREFQQFFPIDTIEESGVIGMKSHSKGKSKRSLAYGIVALEFQLFGLGLLVEGAYTNPDLAGGTLGLRYSF